MKQEDKIEACCITQCDVPMDKTYWDTRWEKNETGWDIGHASPAITKYIDGVKDKNIAILIPGCGNAYEAEYLLEHGFKNITLIDIAPLAVKNLEKRFKGNTAIKILCEDFFEHSGNYDLVLEQTFFSAILPFRRNEYVAKMHELLKNNGSIVGVLFDKQFNNPFPPFGGCPCEYRPIFEKQFQIKKMETCYNSIPPRQGSEVFIHFIKKISV
ncbi:methyltransferase [Flavobacterium agricola]|uniref:Methyltransferase n=1 Tax=Flavobacterium agricola TaxID=2870839 RepID=A0ABY6M3L3_9FLAO|nr:TPMT family class I SAM-dependent methyltransferase [Flavobacterium agricola]UYW02460.1 methyltransferase [Flavobacterium agricola]